MSSASVSIRKAVASDEPRIRACAEDAYRRYVAAIGRKPAPMVADFAAQIEAGAIRVALDSQGAIQGFVVFHAHADHVLLENVAVFPAHAGRGIGKALIEACEQAARRQGLRSVRLYTNAKMAANLRIYPKLGFVEVGRRREDGFDRVYFEKALR
jgi:ribosomal protein S18 acetylase RimI-like enzyme